MFETSACATHQISRRILSDRFSSRPAEDYDIHSITAATGGVDLPSPRSSPIPPVRCQHNQSPRFISSKKVDFLLWEDPLLRRFFQFPDRFGIHPQTNLPYPPPCPTL